MASIINASTSTGLVTTADTSGVLQLQTGGTAAVTVGTDQSFNFSATGQRITGDFSNATVANRVMFQSSTTNGNTLIGAIPNGTGQNARIQTFASSDPTNTATLSIESNSSISQAAITSGITGTGTYLPMTFYTGGSERVRVDASGNVGIGTSSPAGGANRVVDVYGSGSSAINFHNATSGTTATDGGLVGQYGSDLVLYNYEAGIIQFGTSNAERARIDSSGNLLVGGTTSPALGRLYVTGTTGNAYSNFGGDHTFYTCNGGGFNAAATAYTVNRQLSTGRSINAAGTINASGADYAEYMTKAGDFVVAKGDVVGINSQGKLTNVFADAVSFCVKSTDPSYVGGDTWGNEDAVGQRPAPNAPQEEQDAFEAALEAARQTVDRIAFAGQVPVNVLGATAGQYIIPVNDNGAIKGEAVSNPTFEQYQTAVGKVIAIESDGRAKIIVKVA